MKRQEELNEAWCKYMGKCSTEILHALAFALRWCDEHPNWISVEDELPPKDSEYDDNSIVVLTTDGNDVYKGLYRSGEYLSGWFTHDLWALDNITHWMPIPPPLTIRERYKNIAKSDFVKEHYHNKSLGDAEEIKDELDCIGSDGSDPFDEVEKQIESQHKKEEKQ